MRVARPHRLALALVAALAVALPPLACSSPLTREAPVKTRYKLTTERPPNPTGPVIGGVLRLGRTRVARAFERVGFVYQVDANTFESDFWNEFFTPPSVQLREAVGQWLLGSGLFEVVLGYADPTSEDFLMETRIHRLFADVRDRDAPRAILDVGVVIVDARTPDFLEVFDERFVVEEAVPTASAREISKAWNRALGRILQDLEEDLRARGRLAPIHGRQRSGR